MNDADGIRGVFFDAFRTLIELEAGYPPAFAEVCRDFGTPVDASAVARVLPSIERRMERLERARDSLACSAEELARRWVAFNDEIFRALGLDADVEAFTTEIERRFDAGAYTRPYDDSLPTLETLRRCGYRVGVISNGTPGVANCLNLAGITERVEFVLVSGVVGWEKPAPEIFHMGLEASGLRPETVVFVGDHYEADVQGARAVGMQAVLIDRGGQSTQTDCPVVSDLNEFLHWLDGEQSSTGPPQST